MKVSARILSLVILAALPGILAAAGPASAASERILNFQSRVNIQPDSSMTVTEDITVRATGQTIRRGIVRDFPTTYRDRHGNTVKVGFRVEEIYRDGRPEPYHLNDVANGVKIFIGSKDVFLRPGDYTYTIKYRTDRQLGYFKDFDELYWNVTGNGWTFPIDSAQAIIDLPPGAKILQEAGYTGRQGERGQDYTVRRGDGFIVFKTTRALAPREGLTVAVAWPKGLVQEPSGLARTGFFFWDNLGAVAGLLGLVLVLVYYLRVWFRVGRDPAAGTIIPLFTPPQDFSPSAVRFLMHQGFDNKALAAGVVDMAVKGYLTIEEKEDGLLFKSRTYTLHRKGSSTDSLTSDEALTALRLFDGGDTLELKSENHTAIKEALEKMKTTLRTKIEKHYFLTNRDSFIPGVVLTFLVLGLIVVASPRRLEAIFSSVWLTVWTVGCAFLAVAVYRKWLEARGGGFGRVLGALFLTFFALPFFTFELMGLGFFGLAISPVAALCFAGMVFVNPLFYYLLKAPTLAGRRLMDQIEGFKMFLSVAEKDRLEVLHPPDKTPELYEKYLPYALALDVENEWSEQFAEVLAQAQVDGRPYSPAWYSGRSFHGFDSSGFAADLGSSFSGAISSASSPPGSSSGSGGGGSSGGGGGGGGGSGW